MSAPSSQSVPVRTFSTRIANQMRHLLRGQGQPFTDSVIEAAEAHQLSSGGLRLRARLAYECGTALNLEDDQAFMLAVICELLHNASLIHDDLADRADFRRGKASINQAFGNEVALCLGDLYISAAYAAVAHCHSDGKILTTLLTHLHAAIANTVHGQIGASHTATQQNVSRSIEASKAKTASLFSLALELPLIASDKQEYLEVAKSACQHFALAYQLLDDIEDYAEDTALDHQFGNGNLLRIFERDTDIKAPQQQARMLLISSLNAAEHKAKLLPEGCTEPLVSAIHGLRQKATGMTLEGAEA